MLMYRNLALIKIFSNFFLHDDPQKLPKCQTNRSILSFSKSRETRRQINSEQTVVQSFHQLQKCGSSKLIFFSSSNGTKPCEKILPKKLLERITRPLSLCSESHNQAIMSHRAEIFCFSSVLSSTNRRRLLHCKIVGKRRLS